MIAVSVAHEIKPKGFFFDFPNINGVPRLKFRLFKGGIMGFRTNEGELNAFSFLAYGRILSLKLKIARSAQSVVST